MSGGVYFYDCTGYSGASQNNFDQAGTVLVECTMGGFIPAYILANNIKIIGGSFYSDVNNAAADAILLASGITGTVIRGPRCYVTNAGAKAIGTESVVAQNVEFVGVIGNTGVDANVTQSSVAVPDAQGNIFG
jgi:hypothetical protein